MCLSDCVLFQSAVTPNIYKRRLDFPYKQRNYLGFPYKKITSIHVQNPSQIRTGLSQLSKTVRFKLAAPCGSFLWWETILDGNEPKSNLDRFDEANNFHVESFFIRGYLEGQIALAKQAIIRATHQTCAWWGVPHLAS